MSPASEPQMNLSPNHVRETDMPNSETTPKVIAAVPLSYQRPGDDAVTSISRKKRKPSETPEGWICEPRTRRNGVVDKFYRHKELNIRCRSLKEIERYYVHGIRPGRRRKEKEQEIIAEERKKSEAKENVIISPSSQACVQGEAEKNIRKLEIYTGSNKSEAEIVVGNFLAEAWCNMMHPFDNKEESKEEIERKLQEDREEMGRKLQREFQEKCKKLQRKLQEEREEMQRKLQEKRAQLQHWMQDEIDQRIQAQLGAIMPIILQGQIRPTSGDCKKNFIQTSKTYVDSSAIPKGC